MISIQFQHFASNEILQQSITIKSERVNFISDQLLKKYFCILCQGTEYLISPELQESGLNGNLK